MLISPPFLLPTPSHEMETADSGDSIVPDHNVCSANMQECSPGNGAYPVSHNLGWHGGPHLIAPRDAQGQIVPVRAIADGTVVYSRTTSDDSPALLYRGVRTDDGCVVIKHETEIGEGESAKVVFFSIYLHLQSVLGSIKPGKKIYRKDLLGVTGEIYGQSGQMHFEIVCDNANLRKLTGRDTGLLTAQNGRKDAVYGDIWFKVPKGAPVFQKEPNPYRRDDRDSAPCRGIEPQDATLTQWEYVIRMRYERGDCTLTTFQKQDDGRYGEVGTQKTKNYEYDLYKEANRLKAGYVELNRVGNGAFAKVPSPSGLYEMIRFGRMLDPNEWTAGAEFGHWRQIKTPEVNGWISLNQPEIGVYSDADFPHWAGWSLIDDDTTPDSLCDSPTIRNWLDLNRDGTVTHDEAVTALHNPIVRERMAKAICKFPIEWTKNGIDERWGWLMSKHQAQPTVLTKDDFATLKAHIEALAFWEDAKANDATLPAWNDCWHLPPTAFIEHFRKCGWLSSYELAQCIPRSVMRLTGTQFVSQSASWVSAFTNSAKWSRNLNGTMRKYSISSTPRRTLHFLAQLMEESSYFGFVHEINGESQPYSPYFGRGLIQLTHTENYKKYGEFRGFPVDNSPAAVQFSEIRWNPNNLIAQSNRVFNSQNCADSSGLYWTCSAMTAIGRNTLITSDRGVSLDDIIIASKSTNGNVAVENINGLDNRFQSFILMKDVLLDTITPQGPALVSFVWRRNSTKETVLNADGTAVLDPHTRRPKKRFFSTTHTINMSNTRQRP
jgi:murein DD-endopeptidase MepM/ murein hydrolase activator NlpD